MESKHQNLLKFLGIVVIITGILSVVADVLSGWSSDPRGMETAVSVDLDVIKYLFLGKARWNYILGNYFGIFILPIFHLIGLYCVSLLIKPLGKVTARVFYLVSAYLITIGAGFHGSLAFVGEIVQSGNQDLINGLRDYWQPWAYIFVVFYATMCLVLAAVVLSNKTAYSRWMLIISPLGVLILSTVIIAVLPSSMTGVKSFLAVTGLNLPLLIFYVTSIGVLLKQEEVELSI